MSRASGSPLGKLYNKFHNWKNSIRASVRVSEPIAKKQKGLKVYTESKDERGHVLGLKNSTLDYEQKMTHWNGCVALRLNSINKEHENQSYRITETWPLYKEPNGFQLVRF